MARQPLVDAVTRDASAVGGAPARSRFASLVVSLRPGQWTKNLLVFAGLLFGKQLFEPRALAVTCAAFAIFCALSGVVYLLNDVADRDADRRHPLKSRRPIASGQLSPGVALAAAVVLASWLLAAAFCPAPGVRPRRARLRRAERGVFGAAQAHRHHRRADDRDRVRAARGGGRGGDRRADQPLAADLHDPARPVPRAEQAAARADAAGGRRDRPPADPRRVQPLPARPDDRRRHGLDARRVHLLHDQPGDRAELQHGVPRADHPVPPLRHLPVPLPGSPEGRRGKPGRDAADRPPAAGVRGPLGRGGRRHRVRAGGSASAALIGLRFPHDNWHELGFDN